MKMIIEIDNLTEAQKIAIEDMMYTWQMLGNIGSSRWTSFFSDGGGNFRPKITVDGNKPQSTDIIDEDNKWRICKVREGNSKTKFNDTEPKWGNLYDVYMIDFDTIAWVVNDKNYQRDKKIDKIVDKN